VDITITPLYLTGLRLYESGKKTSENKTAIVASISPPSRMHPSTSVLSLPLNLSPKKSSARSIRFGNATSFPSIKYCQQPASPLSKYSIDLAVSRNGKKHPLGTACLVINGEQICKSTIDIPVIRSYPKVKRMFGVKSRKNAVPLHNNDVQKHMLGSDATLRVIVDIHEAEDAAENIESYKEDNSIFSNFLVEIDDYPLQSGASTASNPVHVASSGSKNVTATTKSSEMSTDGSYTTGSYSSLSLNTMREISGLTSLCFDNLSASETEKSGDSDSTQSLSRSSESYPWIPDDDSLPSQLGVEVLPMERADDTPIHPNDTPVLDSATGVGYVFRKILHCTRVSVADGKRVSF
jgi:hypothetical protein